MSADECIQQQNLFEIPRRKCTPYSVLAVVLHSTIYGLISYVTVYATSEISCRPVCGHIAYNDVSTSVVPRHDNN